MELSRRRKRKPRMAVMQFLKIRKFSGAMKFLAVKRFSKRRKSAETSILELPFDLAINIFSRLPIDAIFCSKSVCKLWRTYLADPEFFRVYTSTHVIVFSSKSSLLRIAQLRPKETASTMIPGRHLFLRDPQLLRDRDDKLVGSCNGLVCLLHHNINGTWITDYDRLTVSNPMTREFTWLPPLQESYLRQEAFLFGFSSKTGEYKVLQIFKRELNDPAKARVCTVNGSGGWRAILNQRFPFPLHNGYDDVIGVTFNGALHWIAVEDLQGFRPGLRFLVSFDIAEEKMQQIPLPAEKIQFFKFGLGVLRDCLCIFQAADHDSLLNVWSMKEYGVMESWTKETIRNPFASSPHWFWTYHPLVHLNDNEMIALVWNDVAANLVSYHREENTTELLDVQHEFRRGQILPYVPSLLPLDYLLNGKSSSETP